MCGARLDIDLAAVGRPVQALIAVRVRPPSRRTIEGSRNRVTRLPETLGVLVTTGTEDFLLQVAVPDGQTLYSLVIDQLTERAEIAGVRTSVIHEHSVSDVIA